MQTEKLQLLSLFTSTETKVGVSRSVALKIFIPTQLPKKSKGLAEGFTVRYLLKSSGVRRHLLGNLLFKNISVLDWFLLFDQLQRNKRSFSRLYSACLFGVLTTSSNTLKKGSDWFSQTRPIRKQLIKQKASAAASGLIAEKSLLDLMLKILDIPKEGSVLRLDSIRTIEGPSMVKIQKPIPVGSLGVGYKDKGSMRLSHEPDPEVFAEYNDDILILDFSDSEDWQLLSKNFHS